MELKNREYVGNEDSKFVPVFMTEEIRNLTESAILDECELYKDNHEEIIEQEILIENNGIKAEQITELDAVNIINESVKLLNDCELDSKEKFILRSLNEASNENDLIISESYITRVIDDNKRNLFNNILDNKKIQLVYHNNNSNDIISLQEADNLLNKIKYKEFNLNDYKDNLNIVSECVDFLIKSRPNDLDYIELTKIRDDIKSLS